LYVLDGELAVRAGDGELRARAGSWVQVRPGVASAVSSAGSESARYLDVRTPAT
jgi:quercetin dioxygenase-like cupin family protein